MAHPVKGNTLDIGNSKVWKFPHPETPAILRNLEKSRDIFDFEVPKLKDKSFAAEILRFKKTLELWAIVPGQKFTTPHHIMWGSLTKGPKYAEYIDDLNKSSIRLSAANDFSHNLEQIDECGTEIEGLDSIFPASHLLPFEVGEDTNDYDWSDVPVDIPEELLERFRDKVREFVKEVDCEPPRIDSIDLLKLMGSATGYDDKNDIRIPKSALKGKDPSLELERGVFKFSLTSVYKNPHENRVIVVPTSKTLNSLMLLEKQLKMVLDVPSDTFNEKNFFWLEEFLTGYGKYHYLMSDQKKCGLTFPRELLKELFSVLEDSYPEWDFNLFEEGFTYPEISKIGGKIFTPKRGVGLGMMNGAISAATSIIFEIFKEDYEEYGLIGKFYNDDQVIRYPLRRGDRITTPYDDYDIAQGWDKTMEDYGLIVSKSKPFVSKSGLFLEIYGKDFPINRMKITQYVGNIFRSLTLRTLPERKKFVSQMYDCLPDEYLEMADSAISQVISLSGYEFHPDEVNIPYEIGGWCSVKEEGSNHLFPWISKCGYKYRPYLNLLVVEEPFTRVDPRMKKSLPSLKELQQNLRDFADPELAFDYYSIARSSLLIPSRRFRDCIRAADITVKRRSRAFKEKNLEVSDSNILNIYWDKVIRSGNVYAPPDIPEARAIPCYRGEDTKRNIPMEFFDPVRLVALYQQESGINDYQDIWFPIRVGDAELAAYLFFKYYENLIGYEVSLNEIIIIYHLGLDKYQDLLGACYRMNGVYRLPPFTLPCKELLMMAGTADLSETVTVVDELRMTLPLAQFSPCYSSEDNKLSHMLITIALECDKKGKEVPVPFRTWEDIEHYLFPNRLDSDVIRSLRTHLIPVSDPVPDLPVIPQEFWEEIRNLISQANARRERERRRKQSIFFSLLDWFT